MVLEVPGGLFQQRDVRETPSATGAVVSIIAGVGIDISGTGYITIDGENASTSNKGIAKFNTNDFSISSGDVSLKNKTSYWSCPGTNFKPDAADEASASYIDGSIGVTVAAPRNVRAPVFLPHNAVITSVVVHGNDTSRTWIMKRVDTSGSVTTMATAVVDTADTSITNATIDNQNYGYFIEVACWNTNQIDLASIIYTTDYD